MPAPLTSAPLDLDALRREIDAIDTEIHDRLMRRGELAHAISAAKAKAAAASTKGIKDVPNLMRPAREAQILRRLSARHRGPFPFAAVGAIWREVMSAMTVLQGNFSVGVTVRAPDDQLGEAMLDMARDHFGSIVKLTDYGTPAAVLHSVADGTHSVGLVPWFAENDGGAWWLRLLARDAHAPRVLARLPFFGGTTGDIDALLIGCMPPEPSAEPGGNPDLSDRTLIVVETATEWSRARLSRNLAQVNLDGQIIVVTDEPGENGRHFHLVDVAGFVNDQHSKLADLVASAQEDILRVLSIGSYAVPLGPIDAA